MALQSCALPVLITRPHPQAARFAAQLRTALGDSVTPMISPLLAPEFLHVTLPPGPFGALVLTSETGVRAAAALRQENVPLPDLAFCVGDHSADVAAELGFRAQSASGDAGALLMELIRHRAHAPFLHLCGRETTGDLMAALTTHGVAAQDCVVYAQKEMPLTDEALALIAKPAPVCVPLFSPRSARIFCAAISCVPRRARLLVAAMSPAVADALPTELAATICIASRPDAASMLDAIATCCFKP